MGLPVRNQEKYKQSQFFKTINFEMKERKIRNLHKAIKETSPKLTELIKDIPENDRKYIIQMVNKFMRISQELFEKNIKEIHMISNAVHYDFYNKIEMRLLNDAQRKCLKNFLCSVKNFYIELYFYRYHQKRFVKN